MKSFLKRFAENFFVVFKAFLAAVSIFVGFFAFMALVFALGSWSMVLGPIVLIVLALVIGTLVEMYCFDK